MSELQQRVASAYIRATNEKRYEDSEIFDEVAEILAATEPETVADADVMALLDRITAAIEGINEKLERLNAT